MDLLRRLLLKNKRCIKEEDESRQDKAVMSQTSLHGSDTMLGKHPSETGSVAMEMNARDNMYAHLLYPLCNSYYQTLANRSVSVGDVRITRSSPTPTNSSAVSSPGQSIAASIGDISTCSAPTPPLSTLSSAAPSPCLSAVASPETRRRNWRKIVGRVREDLEGVCSNLIRTKSGSDKDGGNGSSIDISITGVGGSEDAAPIKRRQVTVEFEEDRLARHRQSRWNRFRRHHYNSTPDDLDAPSIHHVQRPTLVLRSIANCKFHAEVYLADLPAGDITLRVINNRIYVMINKLNNNDGKSELYGKIDLPIYVKPRSLNFLFRDEINVLGIFGNTKNYGISLSNTDISSTVESSPSTKRKGILETIWSIDKNFGSMDNIPSSMFEKDSVQNGKCKQPTRESCSVRVRNETVNDIQEDECISKRKAHHQFRRRSFTK